MKSPQESQEDKDDEDEDDEGWEGKDEDRGVEEEEGGGGGGDKENDVSFQIIGSRDGQPGG